MADYPDDADRRIEVNRHRPSRLTTGRRSTDKKDGVSLVTKVTVVILIFLVDVVCLAGDALLLRNTDCI
jgi:hypothetical protein